MVTQRREAQYVQDLREGFRPRFNVECEAGKDAIREFVESHLGQEIKSLGIHYIADADQRSFSQLQRLTSLRSLTLDGMWDSRPLAKGGDELFIFPTSLGNDAVWELSKIDTLCGVWIWYGSFSGTQKELIRRRNPRCRFYENLNKL